MIEPSLFLAFLAGLLTVATPCILPILPPMLAGSVGHKLRPVLIVAGSAITFTLMGGAFSALGLLAGEAREYTRFFLIVMIIAFGATMADEEIGAIYARYSAALIAKLGFGIEPLPKQNSLFSALPLGMALGIVWIPCVGPILGSVLAYASYQGNLLQGSILLLAYSFGLGLPMLAIAYGGKRVSGKLEWAKRNSAAIKKFAGWVLIVSGAAMLLGLDRALQRALLPYVTDLELRVLEMLGVKI